VAQTSTRKQKFCTLETGVLVRA